MPSYVEDYLEDLDYDDSFLEYDDDDDEEEFLFEEDDDWEEEWDDDDESEDIAERRRRRGIWPRFRRRRKSWKRPGGYKGVRGSRSVTARTPSGRTTQLNFNKRFALKTAVDKQNKVFARDIKRNHTNVRKVSKDLSKNTATLDKKVNSLKSQAKKTQQQMQMSMMLPMLMKSDPQIETITLDDTAKTVINVDKVDYKKADTMQSMLPFLLMSGGLGGGDSSNNLMLILALSGSFK